MDEPAADEPEADAEKDSLEDEGTSKRKQRTNEQKPKPKAKAKAKGRPKPDINPAADVEPPVCSTPKPKAKAKAKAKGKEPVPEAAAEPSHDSVEGEEASPVKDKTKSKRVKIDPAEKAFRKRTRAVWNFPELSFACIVVYWSKNGIGIKLKAGKKVDKEALWLSIHTSGVSFLPMQSCMMPCMCMGRGYLLNPPPREDD